MIVGFIIYIGRRNCDGEKRNVTNSVNIYSFRLFSNQLDYIRLFVRISFFFFSLTKYLPTYSFPILIFCWLGPLLNFIYFTNYRNLYESGPKSQIPENRFKFKYILNETNFYCEYNSVKWNDFMCLSASLCKTFKNTNLLFFHQ